MNKEYFTENISTETLAKLIDETLNYEKSQKYKKMPPANIIKIISVAAALVLFIGFLNLMPILLKFDAEPAGPDIAGITNENSYKFVADRGDLFVPEIIEKSFFEKRIMANITDRKVAEKLRAYYTLKDPNAPDLTDRAQKELIVTYPMCQFYAIYAIDPNASEMERNQLLEVFTEYTDITRTELIQMCVDIDYMPFELDDRYANVRFGNTRDILLLDIEWHTYDTYLESIEKLRAREYQSDEFYLKASDKEKQRTDKQVDDFFEDEELLESFEEIYNLLKEGKLYMARLINGKPAKLVYHYEDISDYIDADGYFMFEIYPFSPYVQYYDENDILQYEFFGYALSKREYTPILEEQIIPFCDDLLAKGLITQESYDLYTVKDPLDYYVYMFNFD